MSIELKEIIKFIKDLGYEVKTEVTGKSVVDELLGAFEGARYIQLKTEGF